jgi:hypothetical protein
MTPVLSQISSPLARLVRVSQLLLPDRNAMYGLLQRHFDGVQRSVFDADLAQKNWAILLEDETGLLKGFSTLLFYQTEFRGEACSVVYSGDTIVDPSAWSSSILSRAWIGTVNSLKQQYPGKLYWLLISSGYRTYRFLPTFWQEFYPRYDAVMPSDLQALIHHLCQQQFQEAYDAKTGIIRFSQPQVLRQHLLAIAPQRLADPHVRFFAERNPDYNLGDELACLTEIAEHNLTAAGRRMWFSTPAIGLETAS